MTNAYPSIDPANEDNMTGLFRHVFGKLQQRIDSVIPAIILACDRTQSPPRVQVKPAIQVLKTNGELQSRQPIASVPVVRFGGGGFFIDFPLKSGDAGLLIACDRDSSLFIQSGQESKPNTNRIKNFADSYFLPALIDKNGMISSENMQNAVLQNNDGSVCVALFSDKIKITGNVEITGTLKVDQLLTANSGQNLTGDLDVTGNITATGTITPGV